MSERARNREREREAVREVCVVQRQQANDDDGALELACRGAARAEHRTTSRSRIREVSYNEMTIDNTGERQRDRERRYMDR